MNKSESIIKFAPAFLKAQKATHVAIKGAKNPFYKSTYADLSSVIDACKKPLNDNGISILQNVGHIDTTIGIKTYIETILLHESGEFISDVMIVTMDKEGPQAQGSAISYAKRYSLQSMVLLPSADDDAEGATNRKPDIKKPDAKKSTPMSKLQQEELMEYVDTLPDEASLKLHAWIKKGGITREKATEMLNKCRDMVADNKEKDAIPVDESDIMPNADKQDEIPF